MCIRDRTNTTLNLEELLCGVNELVDTLWIVTLGNEKVEIVKDSMTPEREGECLDYTELCQTYIQEYVYPADLGKWEEILSLNSLRQMAASGVANKSSTCVSVMICWVLSGMRLLFVS